MCTHSHCLYSGEKSISVRQRWMAGSKEDLEGVQNSLARRKPKNARVHAAQIRRFDGSVREAAMANWFLIFFKIVTVIGCRFGGFFPCTLRIPFTRYLNPFTAGFIWDIYIFSY